jgi:hypothetical protein
MRSLPLQCGTIRIASVAGERRDIRVSGLAKARMLWLFRNFYILDFPVLNRKQQQQIAQVWNSKESNAASNDIVSTSPASKAAAVADDFSAGACLDLASLDVIGTIEGYLPQLCPSPLPTKEFRVGDRIKVPALRPCRVRFDVPASLRTHAIWAAMGVLMMAFAIALGPIALGSGVLGSGVPDTKAPYPALRPAASSPVAAAAPTHAAPADPVRAAPPLLAKPSPVPLPSAAADSPAPVAAALSIPPRPLPDAMASIQSAPDLTPPRLAVRTKAPATTFAAPLAKPEVMIRVSVDSEGRVLACRVLQGDHQKISAALDAARRFSFQPCAASRDCVHLLKFTYYGDASIVQRIE